MAGSDEYVVWTINAISGSESTAVALGACGTLSESRADANARLIAAAPDLYAALDSIVSSVSRGTSGDVCQTYDFEEAKAALAKARGEST